MKRKTIVLLSIGLGFALILPYFGQNKRVSAEKKQEIVYSQAECVMEVKSRRILYEDGGEMRLPMASTTKIATAITVLNICKNDTSKLIAIPDIAEGVEGSSVYLKSGDIYSVEELLYGLMLRSGNDCATALATYCSGNIEAFSAEMNKTAQVAGALSTHFANPHGLPCKNHYTTARDLSLITCYALQNSMFKQIVSTQYYTPRHWKNKNKMLTGYDGAIGVKTGYTKEAGRCLVTAAERNGMTLVCSVLNSPMMYERSAVLLDDAFSAYAYTKLLSKDMIFSLKNRKFEQKVHANEDFYYPLMDGELENIEICVFANDNVLDQEIVGQIQIYLAKRLIFSGNLYKL